MRISWVIVRLGKSSFFITVGGTRKIYLKYHRKFSRGNEGGI